MRLVSYLFIFSLSLAFLGCDASHHITKMEKHKERAEKKGAIFSPDTIWQQRIEYRDSLIVKDGDTIRVPIAVIDSVPYPVDVLRYVPMSRQERIALRDSMKHEEKKLKLELKELKVLASMYEDSLVQARKIIESNNKTEVKTTRIENRKFGFWFWLAFALGAAGMFLVLRYIPFAKKLLN